MKHGELDEGAQDHPRMGTGLSARASPAMADGDLLDAEASRPGPHQDLGVDEGAD